MFRFAVLQSCTLEVTIRQWRLDITLCPHRFSSVDLSSLYLDLVKDRCGSKLAAMQFDMCLKEACDCAGYTPPEKAATPGGVAVLVLEMPRSLLDFD